MFRFLCHNFRCKAPTYRVACPDHTPPRSGYRRPAHTPPEARAVPYFYKTVRSPERFPGYPH